MPTPIAKNVILELVVNCMNEKPFKGRSFFIKPFIVVFRLNDSDTFEPSTFISEKWKKPKPEICLIIGCL